MGSPEVEQLAIKLNDMPVLRRRLIVSASGFTEPALRKAKFHGLTCLRLVRGPLPWHGQVDLSQLTSLTVAKRSFVSPANVVLDLKDSRGSEPAPSSAPPNVEVHFASGQSPMKFQEFTDWVAKGVLDSAQSEGPVNRRVEFFDGPTMCANGIEYSIVSAEVAGSVQFAIEQLPMHDSCYLQDESGEPFASTCIFDVDGTLYGLSTAKSELRMFRLPPELRHARPYKQTIRFDAP